MPRDSQIQPGTGDICARFKTADAPDLEKERVTGTSYWERMCAIEGPPSPPPSLLPLLHTHTHKFASKGTIVQCLAGNRCQKHPLLLTGRKEMCLKPPGSGNEKGLCSQKKRGGGGSHQEIPLHHAEGDVLPFSITSAGSRFREQALL